MHYHFVCCVWRKQVEIGTIQKLESLQSDLTGIVRRALQYCGPTRCQLFGNRSNLNKCMSYFVVFCEWYDHVIFDIRSTRRELYWSGV